MARHEFGDAAGCFWVGMYRAMANIIYIYKQTDIYTDNPRDHEEEFCRQLFTTEWHGQCRPPLSPPPDPAESRAAIYDLVWLWLILLDATRSHPPLTTSHLQLPTDQLQVTTRDSLLTTLYFRPPTNASSSTAPQLRKARPVARQPLPRVRHRGVTRPG
jgi:hypothetical protein